MTNALWIRDVGAFGLQIAAVVGAGAGVAFICRLRRPGATLFYWRALLLACLALPLCQPWTVDPAPSTTPSIVAASTVATAGVLEVSTDRPGRVEDVLVGVLVAGISLRAMWLVVGALALRRLRLTAAPLVPMPPTFKEAQARVGTSARILVSDRVAGPMTFGLFRPVVLVPTTVRGMAPGVQEAIAYHELIHVRRRDWLDELFEEAVRTVFWFHPAVWWLVGRIRLSREQVVDWEVIRFTESRERYVDALLVVALAKSSLTLVPAPAFLRRSLLKQRIAHIMQETIMTTRRVIASLAAGAAAVGLAGAVAVRSFPLQAQSRAPGAAGAPVQIAQGGEHLLHGGLPEYPARAIEQQVEGDVILDLAVDDRGEVADARVSSGPDELRRAALESVLRWHYAPQAVSNRSTQVVLRFHLPPPETASTETAAAVLRFHPTLESDREFVTSDGRAFKLRTAEPMKTEPGPFGLQDDRRAEHLMIELKQALENPQTTADQMEELKQKYAHLLARKNKILAERESAAGGDSARAGDEQPFGGSTRLARVRSERVSQSTVAGILARAGIGVGDTVTEDALKRLQLLASRADEHIRVELAHDESGDLVVTFITRSEPEF